jgi:hypothetical protein
MNNIISIQVLEEILKETQQRLASKQQTYSSLSLAIGAQPQDYINEIKSLDLRCKALSRAIEILRFS